MRGSGIAAPSVHAAPVLSTGRLRFVVREERAYREFAEARKAIRSVDVLATVGRNSCGPEVRHWSKEGKGNSAG